MSLNALQKEISDLVADRFPLTNYTPFQRLASLTVQIGDLSDTMLLKCGVKKNHKNQHLNDKEALTAVLVDLLVLSEQLGVDLDKEMERAKHWFKFGVMP